MGIVKVNDARFDGLSSERDEVDDATVGALRTRSAMVCVEGADGTGTILTRSAGRVRRVGKD